MERPNIVSQITWHPLRHLDAHAGAMSGQHGTLVPFLNCILRGTLLYAFFKLILCCHALRTFPSSSGNRLSRSVKSENYRAFNTRP